MDFEATNPMITNGAMNFMFVNYCKSSTNKNDDDTTFENQDTNKNSLGPEINH